MAELVQCYFGQGSMCQTYSQWQITHSVALSRWKFVSPDSEVLPGGSAEYTALPGQLLTANSELWREQESPRLGWPHQGWGSWLQPQYCPAFMVSSCNHHVQTLFSYGLSPAWYLLLVESIDSGLTYIFITNNYPLIPVKSRIQKLNVNILTALFWLS